MDKEEQGHWDHVLMVAKLTVEIDRLQKQAHYHYENGLKKDVEIEQLQKQIRYQEHCDGRIGTHDPICYEYGPRHYECALREIERLREALRLERQLKDDALRAFNEARAALKEGE